MRAAELQEIDAHWPKSPTKTTLAAGFPSACDSYRFACHRVYNVLIHHPGLCRLLILRY